MMVLMIVGMCNLLVADDGVYNKQSVYLFWAVVERIRTMNASLRLLYVVISTIILML